ncbi:ThiF family adenylyltransferase [Maribacter sp. 2-571]|uniref:ThiF family adenylyltransferase n=1 Tax=Maribacter sp. 2-571 TaxID=3417569 RepID=UPI003D349F49
MKSDETKIKRIESLLKKDESLTLVENLKETELHFSGKIEIDYLGVCIVFDIHIPKVYPLTHPNSENISITFRNKTLIGLNHINLDGSVCFHPDKDDDFDRKLLYEIQCLKQWIRDYFVHNKEDDNYAYLIHNTEDNYINQLYFTNTKTNFKKDSYGTFSYSIFSDEKFGDQKLSVRKFFRLGIEDEQFDNWSDTFIKDLKKKKCRKGVYYFIEEEPLMKDNIGRKGIENWSELKDYFSEDFIEYLYTGLKRKFGANYYYDNDMFLLLGYKIPNTESYEEHWDIIRIPKKNIPIDSIKIHKSEQENSKKRFECTLKNYKIKWGSTENIDYKRFFGRGKLNKRITDSRILIIGCGALGSSLAEVLVRGGVKKIVLEDFDIIRGGNLCRANYDLDDMKFFKTDKLIKRLKSISPFVDLNVITVKLNKYEIKAVEKVLNENFDIIFDCSTDTEVTYIIDKLNFSGKTFSLAITNKAKSFVSITGNNLTKQAKIIFDFVENEPPTYIEGTGCGYPTFEANYNDINALLNVGLKVINDNYSKDKTHETLIIQPDFQDEFNIDIKEFEYYYRNDINSSIHISKSVLKVIEEVTRLHYPNEFGGVFTGYKSDEKFIITDILIPDAYENGRTVFIREPGTLNERLKLLHEISDGKIHYLGEWHSHPDGPASPSSTDNNAMKEISKDENIKIDKPLLMIVEVGQIAFDKELYIYDDKKLKKYE